MSRDLCCFDTNEKLLDDIKMNICKADQVKRQCNAIMKSGKVVLGSAQASKTPQNVEVLNSTFNGPNTEHQGPEIHVKRTELPTFSGSRTEWPEFKTVWRELAERNITSSYGLAYELKRSLKGNALKRVKCIYVSRPEAYELIWQRLEEYYDDTSASVQSALESINKLKSVREDDYKGLVHLTWLM